MCPTSGGVEHFVPGDGFAVNEGLHGCLAIAPAPLVGTLLIVAGHPDVEVSLQLRDIAVDPLAESDLIELVEHGLVEPLDDAVGLRAAGLGPAVVDAVLCINRHPCSVRM